MRVIGIGLLLLSSLITTRLLAEEEEFLPNAKQLGVLKSVSDCSVYLAVRQHTRLRYRALLVAKQKIKDFAKRRREALGLCGAPTEESRRALQDEKLARQCPKEFAAWVKSSEHFLNNRFEIQETYRNLQSLEGIINYYCGDIPDVPEKLPEEKKSESPSELIPVPPLIEPSIETPKDQVQESPSALIEPVLPDLFVEEEIPAEKPA